EAISKNGVISVSMSLKNRTMEIRISDNGGGIAPSILNNIGFLGTTDKADGSGLGLFHARTCLESWGGSLQVTSSLGKGTEVYLGFPTVPSPSWLIPQLTNTAQAQPG